MIRAAHRPGPTPAKRQTQRRMPWRAMLALVLIWIGTVSGWNWIWGLLFLSWTLPSLVTGRIHLIEEVERDHHPALFWAIVVTWILLSLALVAIDISALFGQPIPGGLR